MNDATHAVMNDAAAGTLLRMADITVILVGYPEPTGFQIGYFQHGKQVVRCRATPELMKALYNLEEVIKEAL